MTNHPNRASGLAHWADVRETSIEIARSIIGLARSRVGDSLDVETVMQDLWESPTDDERRAIEAVAFAHTDADVLHWGCETCRRQAD